MLHIKPRHKDTARIVSKLVSPKKEIWEDNSWRPLHKLIKTNALNGPTSWADQNIQSDGSDWLACKEVSINIINLGWQKFCSWNPVCKSYLCIWLSHPFSDVGISWTEALPQCSPSCRCSSYIRRSRSKWWPLKYLFKRRLLSIRPFTLWGVRWVVMFSFLCKFWLPIWRQISCSISPTASETCQCFTKHHDWADAPQCIVS